MISFIQWIAKQFKKEFRILSRYERNHPHFFWFIGVDAILSIVLVVVGFQISSASETSNPIEHFLEVSGGTGISVDKLIDHLRQDDGDAFWLGPISGMSSSAVHEVDGLEVVTYLPQGINVQKSITLGLTAETYESSGVYAAHVHALNVADTRTEVASGDMKIQYDTRALNSMTVRFTDKREIVVINYPTKQNLNVLLQDAARLRQIQ